MFDDAIDALQEALSSTVGEEVTYTSAATNAVIKLDAVRARSVINVQSTDGAILQVNSSDFIVEARKLSSLVSNQAGRYMPAKGDTITITHNNADPRSQDPSWSETYELMSPAFTPSDHAGQRLRLHTVRTS